MDFKTLIVIMAIAIAVSNAADLGVTSNLAIAPVDTVAEATGLYSRSKRQFYGGYGGGGFSGASANAGASSFGGSPFGGFGGSNSFASANAASGAFGK